MNERRTAMALLTLCLVVGSSEVTAQRGRPTRQLRQAQDVLQRAVPTLRRATPVYLDTVQLARLAEAGQTVPLPFARRDGSVVVKGARLNRLDLRLPEVIHAILKDGVAQGYELLPLPPPQTYQGVVVGGAVIGSAALTVSELAVEGNLLDLDGWSVIEPLEPLLRNHGVAAYTRETVLDDFNHVVYNVETTFSRRGSPRRGPRDRRRGRGDPPPRPAPEGPLRLTMVADGDREFLESYPVGSVMPFWQKQETLLNQLDWFYNCIEPEANEHNSYARCDNDFDGGHDAFQVRIRTARLEVWKDGGPDAAGRGELLRQSMRETHQSSPPCCGPPHTAGMASLVHFFSGKDLEQGAGLAAGVGGLDEYGEAGCFPPPGGGDFCHHALSQMVPGFEFPGTAFQQQLLVAHEVGHNNGADEDVIGLPVSWLFGTSQGPPIMHSGLGGFSPRTKFLFSERDAALEVAPLLREKLGPDGP